MLFRSMTKDVRDAALMFDVISGYDEKDSSSANKPKVSFLNSVKNNVKGDRKSVV